MHRVACINVPAFPLQILFRKHPEWRNSPAAVVDTDKTQGRLQWVNQLARKKGILPGLRHAQAILLTPELKAGVVTKKEADDAIKTIQRSLALFSPEIDITHSDKGIFWCNAQGLSYLYPDLFQWGQGIRKTLSTLQLHSSLVVGFDRFASYALARAHPNRILVFSSPEEERASTVDLPLDRLDLPPKLRARLAKLGILSLGQFCSLPRDGLSERFGKEAATLHSLACGDGWNPLRTKHLPPSYAVNIDLDYPEKNSMRLVFAIKQSLDKLLALLAKDHCAVESLFVHCKLDHSSRVLTHEIQPAEPTLQSRILLSLLQTRLESSPPPIGVSEVTLVAKEVQATNEQLQLFSQSPTRNIRAANEVFARIRADIGNDAIVYAVFRDAHLPEAQYAWQPCLHVNVAKVPPANNRKTTVRRFFYKARPFAASLRFNPQYLEISDSGPLRTIAGPHILSGGWWNKHIHRIYYYLEGSQGDLLWVYFDQVRHTWFLQGQVE